MHIFQGRVLRVVLVVSVMVLSLVVLSGFFAGEAIAQDTGEKFYEELIGGESPTQIAPIQKFEMTYDPGGMLDIVRKVHGFLLYIFFMFGTFIVGIGVAIFDWAFGLGLMEQFAGVSETVANAYDTKVLGPANVIHLSLGILGTYAAFRMMNGYVGEGMRQLGLSFVLLMLVMTMMQDISGLVVNSASFFKDTTEVIIAAGAGQDGGGDAESSLRASLGSVFIEQPYMLMNWGEPVPPGHPCREIAEEVLRTGPHWTDDKPRDMMRAKPECEPLAEFNEDPTAWRFLGVIMMDNAALFLFGFLGLAAVFAVLAQFFAVFLAMTIPIALVLAPLPAGMRYGIGWWLGRVFQVLVMFVFMSFVVSGLLAISTAFFKEASGGDQSLLLNLAAIIAAIVALSIVLLYLMTKTDNIGRAVGGFITGTTGFGGGGPATAAASRVQTTVIPAIIPRRGSLRPGSDNGSGSPPPSPTGGGSGSSIPARFRSGRFSRTP